MRQSNNSLSIFYEKETPQSIEICAEANAMCLESTAVSDLCVDEPSNMHATLDISRIKSATSSVSASPQLKPSRGDGNHAALDSLPPLQDSFSEDSDGSSTLTVTSNKRTTSAQSQQKLRRTGSGKGLSSSGSKLMLNSIQENKEEEDKFMTDDDKDSSRQMKADCYWIQCTQCKKYRRLPLSVKDSISPTRNWTCKDNIFDKHRISCDVPEDDAVNTSITPVPERFSVEYLRDKKKFLQNLNDFHCRTTGGALMVRTPTLGRKELDLFRLYREVKSLGGCEAVVAKEGTWAKIYRGMENFSPTETSASFRLKKMYTKYLYPFEMYVMQENLSSEALTTETIQFKKGYVFQSTLPALGGKNKKRKSSSNEGEEEEPLNKKIKALGINTPNSVLNNDDLESPTCQASLNTAFTKILQAAACSDASEDSEQDDDVPSPKGSSSDERVTEPHEEDSLVPCESYHQPKCLILKTSTLIESAPTSHYLAWDLLVSVSDEAQYSLTPC
jgi:hypothetical protein